MLEARSSAAEGQRRGRAAGAAAAGRQARRRRCRLQLGLNLVRRLGLVQFGHAGLELGAAAFNRDLAAGEADPHVAGECPQGGRGVGGLPGERTGGVEFRQGHAKVPLHGLGEAGIADRRRGGRWREAAEGESADDGDRRDRRRSRRRRQPASRGGQSASLRRGRRRTAVPDSANAGTADKVPASAIARAAAARTIGWNFGVFTGYTALPYLPSLARMAASSRDVTPWRNR